MLELDDMLFINAGSLLDLLSRCLAWISKAGGELSQLLQAYTPQRRQKRALSFLQRSLREAWPFK